MKANATDSKATATKAKPKTTMDVPAMPVMAATVVGRRRNSACSMVNPPVSTPIPKSVRRSRTQVNAEPPIVQSAPLQSAGTSKQARLISMLNDSSGATLEQMMSLTGWQAHSVRGVISGVLRKRLNLNVVCTPDPAGGARIYRVATA